MPKTQRDYSRKWRATPAGKYAEQKRFARQRGVGFQISFDEWWAVWQDSGRWEERGNRYGQYVMSRNGDEGPYKVGNVSIQPFSTNHQDGLKKATRVSAERRHTRKTTTVRYDDAVGGKVKTTYGAKEAPF